MVPLSAGADTTNTIFVITIIARFIWQRVRCNTVHSEAILVEKRYAQANYFLFRLRGLGRD
jgi:hypothetical protein